MPSCGDLGQDAQLNFVSWSKEAKDKEGVLKKVAAAIHDMTWWVNAEYSNIFAGVALGFIALMVSPLVVFGTWVAISAYGGEGPEEFMATNALIYEFTFMGFSDLRNWSPPSFSIDPSLVAELPAYLAMYLASLSEMTSSELYKASQAFNSLSAFVAFLKPLICAVPSMLTMDCAESLGEKVGASKNASFALEAPVDLDNSGDAAKLQTKEALASLTDDATKARQLELPKSAGVV